MSRTMVELLAREMDRAWKSFCDALEGLSGDEYRWRPTDDALTLDDLLLPGSERWRTIAGSSGQIRTMRAFYRAARRPASRPRV